MYVGAAVGRQRMTVAVHRVNVAGLVRPIPGRLAQARNLGLCRTRDRTGAAAEANQAYRARTSSGRRRTNCGNCFSAPARERPERHPAIRTSNRGHT